MRRFLKTSLTIVKEVFRKPFGNTTLTSSENSGENQILVIEKVDPGSESNLDKIPKSPDEKLNRNMKDTKITISPVFKLAFITAAGFTLLSLTVVVLMTILISGEFSDQQRKLFDLCSTTWQMGFGAIIGLIGGKAI
jgi:hypothetical protein